MTKQTKIIVSIIVIIAAIAVGYAIYKGSSKPSSNEQIKIGFIGPLTGDAAAYGEVWRNVVALAVDEINNSGGINGKPIEMIYEDGKCTGGGAASAMQKLANVDQVKVVIGGFCSEESIAAVPIATQAHVALFSPASSNPSLTNSSKYFSRDYPSDFSAGSVLANTAFAKNYKKIAVLKEQTEFTQGIYKVFSDTMIGLGGNVTEEQFQSTATDLRSQITKLRFQNPDALFINVHTLAVASRIFKQLIELGWKPQLFVGDVVTTDPTAISNNASFLEGAIGTEFGVDPSNPKFQHLIDAYKQKYGKEPNYQTYDQTIYDAVYILKDAISAVGYDGDKISDYLHRLTNWSGASGLITIGTDGDRTAGARAVIIKNGAVQVLQ